MSWSGKGKVRAREIEHGVEIAIDGITTQARYYKPLVYEFFRKAWRGSRPSWGEFGVDIVMEYVGDPPWNDLDNLAGMARECHSRKTQRDMGHKVAMGCDADGYPLDPDHDWQKSRESLGDKPTGSLYAHRRS